MTVIGTRPDTNSSQLSWELRSSRAQELNLDDFVREKLSHRIDSMAQFSRIQHFIPLASVSLQACWILAIWWTGASSNTQKLPVLIFLTFSVGVFFYWVPVDFLLRVRRFCQARRLPIFHSDIVALSVLVLVIGLVYSVYQEFGALVAENGVYNASLVVTREGMTAFFAQYRDLYWLGIQHPPLIPVINGYAMKLAGENLLVIRLLSLGFGLGSVIVLYKLGNELYDREVGLTASVLFLSFPYFFRLSAAASNDIQVTFFFLLTLFAVFRLRRLPSIKFVMLGGIALGLGLLSKYPMVLIYPLIGYLIWQDRSRPTVRGQLLLLSFISLAIFLTWLAYAYQNGIFARQSQTLSGFSQSVVATIWGRWMFLEFLSTRLPFALGVYMLPILLLGGICTIGRNRNQIDSFLLLWIVCVFGFFSATLPDARYCMPAFPALALLMARGLAQVPQVREKVLWLVVVECGIALYLFVDWRRSSHMFINDYLHQMP